MERVLGLDVGDKTIGIAVSDPLGMTAQGVETIHRTTLEADMKRLLELTREYETVRLIVGYPRNMNGSEGPRCQFVKDFCDETKKYIPNAEIVLWDERMSTVAAARSLIEADVSRRKRKKVIDKMAAVFILQGWLDSRA